MPSYFAKHMIIVSYRQRLKLLGCDFECLVRNNNNLGLLIFRKIFSRYLLGGIKITSSHKVTLYGMNSLAASVRFDLMNYATNFGTVFIIDLSISS